MPSSCVLFDPLIERLICDFIEGGFLEKRGWLKYTAYYRQCREFVRCKLASDVGDIVGFPGPRILANRSLTIHDESQSEAYIRWAMTRKMKWPFLLPMKTHLTRQFLQHQRNELAVKLLFVLDSGNHLQRIRNALQDSMRAYELNDAVRALLAHVVETHTAERCLTSWMSSDWPKVCLDERCWDSCAYSEISEFSTACFCARVRHQCDLACKAWGLDGFTATCYDNAWGNPHDYKHEVSRVYPETPEWLREAAAAATKRKPRGPDAKYGFYGPFKYTSGRIYATVYKQRTLGNSDDGSEDGDDDDDFGFPPLRMFTTEGIIAVGDSNLRHFPFARVL